MRCWILLFTGALIASAAGPIDFGVGEVNQALASRNLRWKIKYELNLEAPETYRIEPYSAGSGHVTGGDLRGLMYGLLEAADQIRATGRLTLTHATPMIPSRGVRMFVDHGDLTPYSEDFWRAYFQTLARSRLNRFTLIFASENPYQFLDHNLPMLRSISQTAAEYAVDFTLGFWDTSETSQVDKSTHDVLLKLLADCPAIRNIELRPRVADADAYRDTVFQALHETGRRVALVPRGALFHPVIVKTAEDSGVALRMPWKTWPDGFEIDPPPGAGHETFYWLWGRLAYDPKTKPPHALSADEYRAAAQIVAQLRNALLIDPDSYLWPATYPPPLAIDPATVSSDFVATIAEAVRNRVGNVPSAKLTPPEIADSLESNSVALETSTVPDFQLLVELARDHAHRLRTAYDAEMPENSGPVKLPPRPQIVHAPIKIVAPDQPITLTLQINPVKDVRAVRLHYRALDTSEWKTIEKAPGSLLFTIPAADLLPDTQLVYYFEILNRENSGWFEPDPWNAIPYHWVRVQPE